MWAIILCDTLTTLWYFVLQGITWDWALGGWCVFQVAKQQQTQPKTFMAFFCGEQKSFAMRNAFLSMQEQLEGQGLTLPLGKALGSACSSWWGFSKCFEDSGREITSTLEQQILGKTNESAQCILEYVGWTSMHLAGWCFRMHPASILVTYHSMATLSQFHLCT